MFIRADNNEKIIANEGNHYNVLMPGQVIQAWWAVDASFLVAAVIGGVASFLLPETR